MLIRRARRRYLWNLAVIQATHAACIAMGGLILLLVLGTQILDWPWLVGLFGVSFGLGFWWTFRRFPSSYGVAQQVDRNLGLHDSLSTALFFSAAPAARKAAPEMREAQLAAAERLCEDVDLARAIPLAVPRSVYAMAALGLVATSLFALRYGISHRLDLKASLPAMVIDAFQLLPREEAKLRKRENQQRFQDLLKQLGLSVDRQQDKTGKGQDADPASTNETVTQDGKKGDAADHAADRAPKPLDIKVEQTKEGQSPQGKGESAGENGKGDRNESNEGDAENDQQQAASNSKQGSNSGESNSLLDKFRDAMQNLLSKLKSGQKPGEGQQASNSQGRQDMGQPLQSPGRKGAESAGRQQSQGMPNSSSQGQEQAEGAQQASQGPGQRGGRDADTEQAKEGRSGIGKENGAKDIKQAEQLAAMGKISEIIGKRSQNLTGEVMVEVASGKQQLRTAYSQQNAAHAEAGGEIHRDEIPLAYQRYVQQYFEEIRKPAAAPSKQK